jgi:tRNA nucleotidyltransferase (CCA-adding enzyme)
MDLIVTHSNADFDALSSLVAAQKLYPHAQLLLPGSQEPKVREFLSLCKDLIDIKTEKECSLSHVRRLVVVDTRHASRIGIAAQLLKRKRMHVTVYDHHPRTQFDIKATRDYYQEIGATVTMLVNRIRTKRLPLNPLEATLMTLGIYEETGSLTYRTTTQNDLDAVGYLLSAGANLTVVSSYLNRELSDMELGFLAQLMHATRTYNIKGINIAFTEGIAKAYVGELGSIIHKLIDVENIKVLFAFIKIGKKIQLVARSRLEGIDVNKLLKEFHGGGHPTAASATLRDVSVGEAERTLLKLLPSYIKITIVARDLMNKPVITAHIDEKVTDVRKKLRRLGLKGIVVLDGSKIAGIVTAGDLNKAIRHNLGHSRVKGYMSSNVITITPSTPLHEIQRAMYENKIGRLPVVERGALQGIVTRTDVMKVLYGDLFTEQFTGRRRGPATNIQDDMKRRLPSSIYRTLRLIGRLARSHGFRAYVVGGFVRDMLLNERNFDVDITVEPDGIAFAQILARQTKGTLVIHKRFGTASIFIKWPQGAIEKEYPTTFRIDVATARTERYERPAALPQVTFSSIRDDLFRRDFTINAIAASLNPDHFGEISDFFGGQRDIVDGVIRVLHDGSFIDDPTRIFRAVRFEQRFNFKIEAHTVDLIQHAVDLKMFEKVEKQRIRDEIILILKEKNPTKALRRMAELHEFRFIHPKIRLHAKIMQTLKTIDEMATYLTAIARTKRTIDVWLMYFMALLECLTTKEVQCLCNEFRFRRGDVLRILSCKDKAAGIVTFLNGSRPIKASKIYQRLQPLSYEVILLMYAKVKKNKRARMRIHNFLTRSSGIRVSMRGDDLKQLGITPGPEFKHILENILYAKIDGKLKTKKDEERFVLKRLRKR